MFYQSQLQLLCETFRKCHIPVTFVDKHDTLDKIVDKSFILLFGDNAYNTLSILDFLGEVENNTIYKLSTPFNLNYVFFFLPESAQDLILLIGPYKAIEMDNQRLLELGESYNIPPQKHNLLIDYYNNITLVTDNSPLFVMLNTFGEYIWGAKNFSIIDVSKELPFDNLPLFSEDDVNDIDDILVNMDRMERRYAFEKEIIDAVSHGQIHKLSHILSTFTNFSFEQRTSDPVRNLKNYCIIMNTILRKAAEQGDVHPIYLDRLSSSYALKIEALNSSKEINELMSDMFYAYCRLVRKHSVKDFSPTVQKAIICINADLSANVSLKTIASALNVNASYLSTIFKKETGETITEYINKRKIKYAKKLLSTTHLQVQTVALHCGIVDINYFSKLFKKYVGKSPKEYRDTKR